MKILNKIKVEVFTLHQYPDRCRVVPELYAQGITQYREMIVDPWRVMYRISNDDVYVLSVFDSRQNIEDVLLNRFVL